MAGHTSSVWQGLCRKHFLLRGTGSAENITPAGQWVYRQRFPLGVLKALPSTRQWFFRKHYPLPGSGCANSTSLWVCQKHFPLPGSGCAKSTSLCLAAGVSKAPPSARHHWGEGKAQSKPGKASTSTRVGVQKALPATGQRVCREPFPLPGNGCAESTTLLVHGRRLPHDCRC